MTSDGEPPFGALAPSPWEEAVRRLARGLPRGYIGRKLASVLLRLAGAARDRAFDVEVFGGEKARLHPRDNICEKRVFLTPQFWDAEERAHLAAAIENAPREGFVFVDAGANAGLYTLFARSIARRADKRLDAICIEPAPEMQRRLRFNMTASGAEAEMRIYPYALTREDGPVAFSTNTDNRGMSRVDPAGGASVDGRALLSVCEEAGLGRIDALKIDIEGHEFPVLSAFFERAPARLRPAIIIIETSHDKKAAALISARGYETVFESSLNTVFRRTESGAPSVRQERSL